MRGLSFYIGEELYAVDVTLVQKVARMLAITPVPTAPSEVVGITNQKGKVVTVLNLKNILGFDKSNEAGLYTNTIVFKYDSNHENQMGFAVEKPGDLIKIENSAIRSPPVTAASDENNYISGIAEIGENFYRIIDIEAIQKKYTGTGNPSVGRKNL